MRNLRKQIKFFQDLAIKELSSKYNTLLPTIPHNAVEFAEATRIIKGENFSLRNRPYLVDIYNNDARELYVVKGRQTEMTEFAINWLLNRLYAFPRTVGLYVTDVEKHVRIFSQDRLNVAIKDSPILAEIAKKHTLHRQRLENNSVLHMVSGWDKFEQARSISADFAFIDEAQSTDISEIAVVRECLSHSPHGQMRVIGTGTSYGTSWEKTYTSGTCMEWDPQNQAWSATNPSATVQSYHIPQSIVPGMTAEMIEFKRHMMNNPFRFTTEVLGWFFKGMRKPLLESDIRALMDKNLDFTAGVNIDHTMPVYMGVDWGGGLQAFTVAWVWQLINKDLPRFKLLYVKKYDDRSTEVQADKIIRLIDTVKADKVVVDAGGGPRQVEKLSDRYAERVFKCHYLSRPGQPFEPISDERRINVDRTWIIETMIDLITRPEVRDDFPHPIPRLIIPGVPERLHEVEWLIDHFTCIEAETSNAAGRPRTIYTHPDDTADDCLHAAAYAYLAWLLDDRTKWNWFRFG